MSTRTLVGKTDRTTTDEPITTYMASYVHGDGYPSGVGVALAEIWQREGKLTTVTDKILTRDWSYLHPGTTADSEGNSPGRGHIAAEPGWGAYYTDEAPGGYVPQPGSIYKNVSFARWIFLFDEPSNALLTYERNESGTYELINTVSPSDASK